MRKALFCVLNTLLSLNGGGRGVYIGPRDEGARRDEMGIQGPSPTAMHRGPRAHGFMRQVPEDPVCTGLPGWPAKIASSASSSSLWPQGYISRT